MNGPFSALDDLTIMPVKEFDYEASGDYLVLINAAGDCLLEFPVGINQETAWELVRKLQPLLNDVWTQGFKRGQTDVKCKLHKLLGMVKATLE